VIEASAFNGVVSINADSTFNYAPNTDFNGPDIISYTISDGDLTDSNMIAVMVNNIDPITLVQDYPLSFSAQVLSAKNASIDIYGDNYASNINDTVIKLTLTADMESVTNHYVNSISGVEIDLNIDWSQFEVLSYTNGTIKGFESQSALDASSPSVWQTYTDESGNLNKLIVASIDTAANPAKTLVDNVDSTGLGVTDRPSVLELGSIYLKPIAGLETVDMSYSALIITNEGSQSFNQVSTTISIDTKLMDAVIHTTNDMLLDNLTLHYYKDGVDTGVSTEVVEGGIKIDTSIEFDFVQLSIATAYQGDINIEDMYGVLDNVAQNIDTFAEHAADSNNDGTIIPRSTT